MVDFNNEVTIGTPASDVEKISILQRRYDVIEALEDYKKKRFNNSIVPISFVRARLLSLFLELQATLKRRWVVDKTATETSKDKYKKVFDTCLNSKEESELVATFFILNEFLDELKLTRIDTTRVYNAQDIEEENKIKGF